MNKLRKKAEALRGAGYSYNMINDRLGIAKSTLSNWFRDKPFVPNRKVIKRIQYGPIISAQVRHNRKVKEVLELRERGVEEIGKFSKRDLWMLGVGLYIGEGTKFIEQIRIINSDPNVVRLAIRWLEDICGFNKKNITIAIHLYPDNNIKSCLRYWSSVTKIPINQFGKTQVDVRTNKSGKKKHKLPYGTAHLGVKSNGRPELGVRLHRRVMGWIDGVYRLV